MEIELGQGYGSHKGNEPGDSIFQKVLPNAVTVTSTDMFAAARSSSLWTLRFGLD